MNSERSMIYIKKYLKIEISIILLLLCFLCLSSFDADTGSPVYTAGDTDAHLIALTFDDGPDAVKTAEILDVLKENGICATFFIVGENAAQNEDVIERMINEGHEIGNHTFAHKYLSGTMRTVMEREIDLCDDVIFNHSEYNSVVFRPPGGLYDATLRAVCADRGYSVVLWSIDTRDWAGNSAADIESEILKYVEDGSIILMHDNIYGEAHTAEALRNVVPKLKKLGYSFVTVSELIGY